jgi:hypothetical protein
MGMRGVEVSRTYRTRETPAILASRFKLLTEVHPIADGATALLNILANAAASGDQGTANYIIT